MMLSCHRFVDFTHTRRHTEREGRDPLTSYIPAFVNGLSLLCRATLAIFVCCLHARRVQNFRPIGEEIEKITSILEIAVASPIETLSVALRTRYRDRSEKSEK